MIDGANIALTFNRDVTPDAATTFDDIEYTHAFTLYTDATMNRRRILAAYDSSGKFGFSSATAALLEFRYSVYEFFRLCVCFADNILNDIPAGAYLMYSESETTCRAKAVTYHFCLASKDKTFSRVVLKFNDLTPSTGVDVRVVLYAVDLEPYLPSHQVYMWGVDVIGGIKNDGSGSDTEGIIPHSVFHGDATSLMVAAKKVGMPVEKIYIDMPATCILSTVLKGGVTYPAGTPFDLKAPFTPHGAVAIHMFLSVDAVHEGVGYTKDTPYGLLFTPSTSICFLQ